MAHHMVRLNIGHHSSYCFFPLCRQASPPGVSGRNAPLVEELSNIPIFTAFSSSDKTKIAVLLSKLSLSLKGQHSA